MSTHIFNMKPGDTLDMKGPIKKWDYQPNQFKEIGLIAGGTGITPMLQLIQRIMADPQDKTRVNLLFANVREGDILLREYLDDLAAKRPNSFKVHYILEKHVFIINVVNTRPPAGWNQGVGYVAENQLKEFMPKPSQGKVFVCGPNPMLNHGNIVIDFVNFSVWIEESRQITRRNWWFAQEIGLCKRRCA